MTPLQLSPPPFKPMTAPIFIPSKKASTTDNEIDSLLNELDDMDDSPPKAKKAATTTTPAKQASSSKPFAATAVQPPKPKDPPQGTDDDIDRLLNELDVKLGKSPNGSTRTTGSMSPSSSSLILNEYEQPMSPPPNKPPHRENDRYTKLLENLQADLDQLGIDEAELPEEKPMKFKHLSENIDLNKLKAMNSTMQAKQEEVKADFVSVKLYHGQACLLLRILPGADGSIIFSRPSRSVEVWVP